MPVHSPSLLDAADEQLVPAGDVAVAELLDLIEFVACENSRHGLELSEVPLPKAEDGSRRAVLIYPRTPFGLLVEPRHALGDLVQAGGQGRVRLEPGGRSSFFHEEGGA